MVKIYLSKVHIPIQPKNKIMWLYISGNWSSFSVLYVIWRLASLPCDIEVEKQNRRPECMTNVSIKHMPRCDLQAGLKWLVLDNGIHQNEAWCVCMRGRAKERVRYFRIGFTPREMFFSSLFFLTFLRMWRNFFLNFEYGENQCLQHTLHGCIL